MKTAAEKKTFDREYALAELLPERERARLAELLSALLAAPARLVEPGAGSRGTPIAVELEPVCFLDAETGRAPREAAAALVAMLLRHAQRYRMAAGLQLETIEADYRALREKHAALETSETRYRDLAANLERRVAEQVGVIEQAQRRLYQAERLASVGQLAAGVAHEINNPLGFVKSNLNSARGYVRRLQEFAGQPADGARPAGALERVVADFPLLLDECLEGVERVARIVRDLRGFSGIDSLGREDTDLNALIGRVGALAAPQVQPRAALSLETGVLPPVHCHPGQIAQALLAILFNAAQAVSAPGEIRIHTAMEGGAVRIEVRDNGGGIPADVLPHVFDPFFTTREVGEGTGLGLTVARDIVQAHGGRIAIESEPGRGTTVSVWLPVTGRTTPG